jgi:sulfite reductase alpha subunit-like flavoprotein
MPRRTFFEQLSFFAADPEQADKLREIASPEGADIYHSYCYREKRSYVEVLEVRAGGQPACGVCLRRHGAPLQR